MKQLYLSEACTPKTLKFEPSEGLQRKNPKTVTAPDLRSPTIRICGWIIAGFLTLSLAEKSSGAPGSLDPSFGGTGKVRTGFGGGISQANAAAIQSDGKLVIAGTTDIDTITRNFTVIRLNTNNTLDTTFGNNGKAITTVSSGPYPYSTPNAVKVQADGKIVVGGYGYQGTNYGFVLVRFNPDGSLDGSFNGTGKIYLDFGGLPSQLSALAIQDDAKIVAVGWVGNGSSPSHFALARFQTNGVLDPSFGTGGTNILTSFYGGANACMLQSDRKIVVTGQGGNFDFATARLTTNGVLDSAFGGGLGYVVTQFQNIPNYTPWAVPTAIATQFGTEAVGNPDKIVVSGWAEYGSASNYVAIVRYNLDGTLDSSFGNGGKVSNTISGGVFGDLPQALVVQGFLFQPRKITIAGRSYVGGKNVMSMARFNANGTPDTTFGGGTGKETISFTPGDDVANAMFLQGGGYLLIGSATFNGNNTDIAAVRTVSDGTLDSTFGTNGIVLIDVADRASQSRGVAVQPDGKTVAAGYTHDGDHNHFAVARYNPDGSLDTTFGANGKVVTKLSTNDEANAVAIQSDGKILVAGRSYNGSSDLFAVVRYNTNGTVDSSFGVNGAATILIASGGGCQAIRIQPDGKILLAGSATVSSYANFAMARFNTNGTIDTSFGGTGSITTAFLPSPSYSSAQGAVLQAGGKIVLAGFMEYINGSSLEENFALARYSTNGAIDFSFGSSGRVTTDFGGGTLDAGNAAVSQTDGKIIVGGSTSIFPNSYVALARYSTNGVLDSSYGNNGLVVTQVGFFSDQVTSLALQSDGKLVSAGISQIGTNNTFFALRYTTNGSVDPSFGVSGVASVDFGTGVSESCYALALDSAGRTVLAGDAGGLFGVARLAGEGELRILSITPQPNGSMHLTGIGFPSVMHTLSASVTLTGFTSIGSVTPDATGNWQFDDSGATGFSTRFYRLSYP